MRLIAIFCLATSAASPQTGLLQQLQFESKLRPNLHHFLYTLARARNGAPDRDRVAVRRAPLDMDGFDSLPADRRKVWDEAIEAYRIHAAPFEIGHGKLVDVNYAVADLPAPEIPAELRDALSKAAPVYRDLWWPRHDAANQAWIRQLLPQVEQFGPKIVSQLAAAYHHEWPTGPIPVEVVGYANFGGAYTTDDPPLIAMASLDEEQQGDDALEELFHECSHLMMDTIDAGLKTRSTTLGKELSRDVSHAILFYTVGEVVRRTVPGHIPYAIHYGLWKRGALGRYYDLLKLHWQPYLDGKTSLEDALDKIVAAI